MWLLPIFFFKLLISIIKTYEESGKYLLQALDFKIKIVMNF